MLLALASAALGAEDAGQRMAERYWIDRASLEGDHGAPSEAGDPTADDATDTLVLPAMPPDWCDGAYARPRFPLPLSVAQEDLPVTASARRGTYDVGGDVTLYDDVRLSQGNRSVTAARARLDSRTRDGELTGGVVFTEPELALTGEAAQINLDSGEVAVDEVDFLLFDAAMRGRAGRLEQDGDGVLTLHRGIFTRCEPGNRNWRMSARRVVVRPEETFATARDAVLRLGRVPVFYLPWVQFPVSDERQSGFLFPSVEYSADDGVDLAVPYYFNLAPNYDLTVTPRYLSQRGAGLEVEGRHLSRWQRTQVTGALLPEDDIYDGELSREDFDDQVAQGVPLGEFEAADRWLVAVDHRGRLGPVDSFIDYTAVSDRDYFRDLGSDVSVSSQIQLQQRGQLSIDRGGFSSRVWTQRFQRLDEIRVDQYERLPEVDLSYQGRLLGPLSVSLRGSWARFTRDNDDLTGAQRVIGDRLHLEPRLSLSLARPWGFFTATGGHRHTQYQLAATPVGLDDEPDRSIGVASVRTGLIFERDLTLFGSGLVQTLEPELYWLYQGYENQDALPRFDASELTFVYSQLFRDNRFAGLDRIGDARQISAGVTTRFYDGATGVEYLRASIGQIAYLEDRQVTLNGQQTRDEEQPSSAIASELSARLGGAWRLTGTLVYDPHDRQVDQAGASINYRRDNRHILNLGYRNQSRNDLSQTDVSLYWPVSAHYGLVGRWNYDLPSQRTVEGFAGIEYNDCCWQLRLLARTFLDVPAGRIRDDVDEDTGIFLQIVFKGLAGVGDRLENVLQQGVRGYRTEDFR